MPEGPVGVSRPLVKGKIAVYCRFEVTGIDDYEDTEQLQTDDKHAKELSGFIREIFNGRDVGVKFHPAGYIVGVEVIIDDTEIGRGQVDSVVSECKAFVEHVASAPARLKPADRDEPKVSIRCK